MKTIIRSLVNASFLLLVSAGTLIAQNLYKTTHRLWEPQPDNVYLQEVAKKITTDGPVQSLAVQDNRCFTVIGGKIWQLNDEVLNIEKNGPDRVKRVISISGDIWALASGGIHRLKNNNWEMIDKREFVDICIHNGVLHGATEEEIIQAGR